jgi:CarD family transcriptional regulator
VFGGIMFNIGDYAVCPGHGVGQIYEIVEENFGGAKTEVYKVKILSNGMNIMVPTNSDGIRGLVGEDEVKNVYDVLNDHDIKIDNSTWNRRYREYKLKINTGSLVEIAEVLRALFLLKTKKPLSFGEKQMLDECKDLLAQEISLSGGDETDKIKNSIDSCFN